ncbi:3-oxoacyl-reductase [Ascodesmis nigricans]|uniref:3-oxoacyl-reductase n=1 Tax=Ascodesmis nigricans TaxID=341454 RepID=A0A4S2MZ61_9PEZI|nr:3-oxoacyl-reductase [Ascodesmis nigricans]
MSSPALTLFGKTAIITGASRGIGSAIAHNLASKGLTNLVLVYTSASSLPLIEDLSRDLRSEFPGLHHVELINADLGTIEGPSKVVNEAKRLLCTGDDLKVDVLINNAGVAGNWKLEEGAGVKDGFERLYNVNVRGPLLLVTNLLPYLPDDRSGRIVNISSVSAACGFEGQSIYGGTKAALDAMTRTWARELKHRATVNSVNPGPVGTDMYESVTPEFQQLMKPFLMNTPAAQVDTEECREKGGRRAKPEEIAGIVGMLCTPDAGWCTGSVVCANGGMIFGLS